MTEQLTQEKVNFKGLTIANETRMTFSNHWILETIISVLRKVESPVNIDVWVPGDKSEKKKKLRIVMIKICNGQNMHCIINSPTLLCSHASHLHLDWCNESPLCDWKFLDRLSTSTLLLLLLLCAFWSGIEIPLSIYSEGCRLTTHADRPPEGVDGVSTPPSAPSCVVASFLQRRRSSYGILHAS